MKQIRVLSVRPPFVLMKDGWIQMIGEALVLLDAATFVVTLGIIELNLSCVWFTIHSEDNHETDT